MRINNIIIILFLQSTLTAIAVADPAQITDGEKEKNVARCTRSNVIRRRLRSDTFVPEEMQDYYNHYVDANYSDLYCEETAAGPGGTIRELVEEINKKFPEFAKEYDPKMVAKQDKANNDYVNGIENYDDDDADDDDEPKPATPVKRAGFDFSSKSCLQGKKENLDGASQVGGTLEIWSCGKCSESTKTSLDFGKVKSKNIKIYLRQIDLRKNKPLGDYIFMDVDQSCSYYTFINSPISHKELPQGVAPPKRKIAR